MLKKFKGIAFTVTAASLLLVGCNNSTEKNTASSSNPATEEIEPVVILTNADEEAVLSMENALKGAGFEGQYVLQSLGTSELGGKLMAEGNDIEADLVTMSSYFIDSAQQQHNMFADLAFETNALVEYPSYYTPILANTGAIFVNTEVIKAKGLELPTSIKDLTNPAYKGLVSIPNIIDSSTAWLLIQSIISEYGEEEGKKIVKALVANVGPHLESSGSGPIKKVKAGEVAAGFGLRHQAVLAKEEGLPINFIDPVEGNFSLTESVAVVKKEEATTKLAMQMAETIIKEAREDLLANYPVELYKGEKIDNDFKPAHPKKFSEPLTVELLEAHQQFFNASK